MDPKNNVQIFEIVEVGSSSLYLWFVRGRAYWHIAVGDILFIVIPGKQDELATFEVKEITTYRRKVLFLGAGMTAELLIEGEEGNSLHEATHLLGKSR